MSDYSLDVSKVKTARRTITVCLLVAFAMLLLGVFAFRHAGTWLVREDNLVKSKALVILSGGLPDRAIAAAEIYRKGYAEEVWLTKPLQPSASMEELHLPYAGEEQYNRMVLIAKGVDPAKIRILEPRILNTADELHAVADELTKQPGATVIVVTSSAHTRRVHTLWNGINKENPSGHLLVAAAHEEYSDVEHWWRSAPDALAVVREYLGLLNAWAGLPLGHAH
jgi:uncharacterized SAM-binding protein YcdF (DUF218 family)